MDANYFCYSLIQSARCKAMSLLSSKIRNCSTVAGCLCSINISHRHAAAHAVYRSWDLQSKGSPHYLHTLQRQNSSRYPAHLSRLAFRKASRAAAAKQERSFSGTSRRAHYHWLRRPININFHFAKLLAYLFWRKNSTGQTKEIPFRVIKFANVNLRLTTGSGAEFQFFFASEQIM